MPQTCLSDVETGKMEDLDCPLCLRVFFEPVTSSCGHSYCKNCLMESFKRARKCPLCRQPCSLTVPVNIVLQKLVETLRKDDYDQRREEEMQRRVELLAELEATTQQLPLLLMHEILYLPGILAELHIFEPRYLRMVRDCLHSTRLFGVYSSFKGRHLGVTLEISRWDELHDGTIALACIVKKRFTAEGITSDFERVIPNSEISNAHYIAEELYYCTPKFINDQPEDPSPLERSLNDYVDRCLDLMHVIERRKLLSSFHPEIDRTFFALSVLDIDYETVISLFQSPSYIHRLKTCLAFAGRNAVARSRLRVKSSKWMLDSTWSTVVVVVSILLFFMLYN